MFSEGVYSRGSFLPCGSRLASSFYQRKPFSMGLPFAVPGASPTLLPGASPTLLPSGPAREQHPDTAGPEKVPDPDAGSSRPASAPMNSPIRGVSRGSPLERIIMFPTEPQDTWLKR